MNVCRQSHGYRHNQGRAPPSPLNVSSCPFDVIPPAMATTSVHTISSFPGRHVNVISALRRSLEPGFLDLA